MTVDGRRVLQQTPPLRDTGRKNLKKKKKKILRNRNNCLESRVDKKKIRARVGYYILLLYYTSVCVYVCVSNYYNFEDARETCVDVSRTLLCINYWVIDK